MGLGVVGPDSQGKEIQRGIQGAQSAEGRAQGSLQKPTTPMATEGTHPSSDPSPLSYQARVPGVQLRLGLGLLSWAPGCKICHSRPCLAEALGMVPPPNFCWAGPMGKLKGVRAAGMGSGSLWGTGGKGCFP